MCNPVGTPHTELFTSLTLQRGGLCGRFSLSGTFLPLHLPATFTRQHTAPPAGRTSPQTCYKISRFRISSFHKRRNKMSFYVLCSCNLQFSLYCYKCCVCFVFVYRFFFFFFQSNEEKWTLDGLSKLCYCEAKLLLRFCYLCLSFLGHVLVVFVSLLVLFYRIVFKKPNEDKGRGVTSLRIVIIKYYYFLSPCRFLS